MVRDDTAELMALGKSITALFDLYLRKELYEDADRLIRVAINLYRVAPADWAAARVALGRCLLDHGSVLDALFEFGLGDGEAQAAEALACSREAAQIFRALIREDPAKHSFDLTTSLLGLARRLANRGDFEEALGAVEEALSLDEPSLATRSEVRQRIDLHRLCGELAAKAGRPDAGALAYEKALSLCREHRKVEDTDFARLLESYALALVQLGRFGDARKALDECEPVLDQHLPDAAYMHRDPIQERSP